VFDEGLDAGGGAAQLPSPIDYEAQLQSVSESMELNLISPPRPGKKLLVLDIDYTIFDTKVIRGQVTRQGSHFACHTRRSAPK
jgi:hypothetical protein